jgi:high affinity Mn2+ porin
LPAPYALICGTVAASLVSLAVLGPASAGDDAPIDDAQNPIVQNFAVHGQFTYTDQQVGGFSAPYRGPNSLTPDTGAETVDATLFLGARLWPGSELWVTPEIDQGFGLDDTLGVAGFPSGEAYKIGKNQPYFRLQRLFVRQTFDLDGRRESFDPSQLQLGGAHSPDRVVLTVGKISVVDIFDNNRYAHDARNDFLNWAAIDAGTFDYAADSWGYTAGAVIEWYREPWAARFGLFDLSDVPNSPDLEPAFHEFQYDVELERGYRLAGRPGRLRLAAFDSRGRMGLLDDAIALGRTTDSPPYVAAVRRYRERLGAHLNLEQELTEGLGLFVRAGKDQGNVEPYEFTDIDRTLSAGLSLQGARWGRAADTIGVAGVLNGISGDRERYLAGGGLGILIGDGRLPNPGPEKIVESYYALSVLGYARVSLDYQFVTNPGYNRDRGPVSIIAARVHAQF